MMYLWMLQLALAGGTVIAERLEIALLWRLLRKAPNCTTAPFPHARQVRLHTKPWCELTISKHQRPCSHLTSAATIVAIKGKQFSDCCLQKQQTVFTDLCPSHSLHHLLLPPHCWLLPPDTAQLGNQLQLLITTRGQDNLYLYSSTSCVGSSFAGHKFRSRCKSRTSFRGSHLYCWACVAASTVPVQLFRDAIPQSLAGEELQGK